MSNTLNPPPPPPDDLQFDRAEYDAAATSADGAATAAPAASCAVCHEPITDAYHTVNQNVVCPRCLAQLQAGLAGGSKTARVLAATAWGVGAGLLGALLWYAVTRITGYQLGLIAIVVGFMVGGAVRRGAHGRGGLVYQLLAVFITYSSIAATNIPDIFMALMDGATQRRAAVATQPATTKHATSDAADPATQPVVATAPQNGDDDSLKGASPFKAALLLIKVLILVLAFAFALPVLAAAERPIGLLITAFALWEAWKMNARPQLNIAGPFAVGTPPPPPPPGQTPQ